MIPVIAAVRVYNSPGRPLKQGLANLSFLRVSVLLLCPKLVGTWPNSDLWHSFRLWHCHCRGFSLAQPSTAGAVSCSEGPVSRGVPTWSIWASPEQCRAEACTAKSDVYRFGILCWQLCGGVPWAAANYNFNMKFHLFGAKTAPYAIQELIIACTSPNPDYRPSAKQALAMLLQVLSTS